MAKGNWREFDDPSSQFSAISQTNIQNQSQLPVRVQRTRAGRRGKIVTIITGLKLGVDEMKPFLKTLKSLCGTGGSIKDESIELQGDQVAMVILFLEKKGYRPKQIGG